MLAYVYDKYTNEYIDTVDVDRDRLRHDNFLFPAHSSLKKPPIPKKGYARCFNFSIDDWEYIEDHRGELVWKTDDVKSPPTKVIKLGPVANGYTLTVPEDIQNKYRHYEIVSAMQIPEINIYHDDINYTFFISPQVMTWIQSVVTSMYLGTVRKFEVPVFHNGKFTMLKLTVSEFAETMNQINNKLSEVLYNEVDHE